MENQLIKGVHEAGCDEAGRGCLAGPVVAAAVILPEQIQCPSFIQDSKQLNNNQKIEAREWILHHAIDYSIKRIEAEKIDEINILNASILAMQECVLGLTVQPEHISVDGNKFKPLIGYHYTTVIKGDSKLHNIAAASILAKTERDAIMKALHKLYPDYGWETNMGYPTLEHKNAILQHGVNKYHRKTFKGVKSI